MSSTTNKAPNRKLRVGVSLYVRDGFQSVWENGIFQNCAFLVQLLNNSPAVEQAYLVNPAGVKPNDAMMLDDMNLPIISLDQAMDMLDVIIEMSAMLDDNWVRAFKEKGGRYAWMRVGNDYVIDVERAMFDKPSASLCNDKPYDAVWTIPEYEVTCKDYFHITTHAPVKFMPHLWTSTFFDKGIASLPEGVNFGYQPNKPRWRVCSFEPNVCMVKTSYIPLLSIEEAYRERPDMIEFVRILNTLHMRENGKFVALSKRLDIVNHGLIGFEGRFAVYEFLAQHGDAVFSHHWENGQNYLYYEALYGGYPLIHNSTFIKDYGYYYPEFDTQAGGKALIEAFNTHDLRLDDYKRDAKKLLYTLDVNNPENVAIYTQELLNLYNN